jgi:hypothetical protein
VYLTPIFLYVFNPPPGHVYPYDIAYNVDAAGMEEILERLPDIDDVTVTRTEGGLDPDSRIWSVTFVTNVAPGGISIDTTNLVLDASNFGSAGLVCLDAAPSSLSATLYCLAEDSQASANPVVVYTSGVGNYSSVNTNIGSRGYLSYVINNLVQVKPTKIHIYIL